MGLREEAENLLREQRRADQDETRRYRQAVMDDVPRAIKQWCVDALGVDEFESFQVIREGENGYDTARWYCIEVEFQLEDITFTGNVMANVGGSAGSLDSVRVKGASPGPIVTNKQSLAVALDYQKR